MRNLTIALTVFISMNSFAYSGYEVVTATKPENIAQYRNWYKNSYEACVNLAKIQKKSVKPFVNIPADFIIDTDTYKSDGKNFSHITTSQIIKVDLTAEKGCASSIAKTQTLRAIKNGKSYLVDVQEDGRHVAQPVQDVMKGQIEDSSNYSQPKVIRGTRLKCMPESAMTQLLGQLCMIENQGTTQFVDYEGKYLQGYARVFTAKDQFGILVTEPVSVKTNVVINPSVFDVK